MAVVFPIVCENFFYNISRGIHMNFLYFENVNCGTHEDLIFGLCQWGYTKNNKKREGKKLNQQNLKKDI